MQPVYDRLYVHPREQIVIYADETTAQVLHEDDKILNQSHIYGCIPVEHLRNTGL